MSGIEPERGSTDFETLTRSEIYRGLQECTPKLQKNDWSPRTWESSGANYLLDQLVMIQHREALEMLEDEQEVGFGL